jgi:hypothetical protein
MTPALLAAALTTSPRPVVCLDTCVLLDLVRTLLGSPVGPVENLEAAIALTGAAAGTPSRAAVVVTDLVRVGWAQSLADTRPEAVVPNASAAVDRFYHLFDAAKALRRTMPPAPDFTTFPSLVVDLIAVPQSLLGVALTIDRDPACAGRALDRVVNKVKPAANGKAKDALHLEHYLELSRLIGGTGVATRRAFVSSDKEAFWAGKKPPAKPDPDLQANDFGPAGLEFYGSLAEVVRALGI